MVLPYINMNPPWVYMSSQSWTPLPPPSLYHLSGSSQCWYELFNVIFLKIFYFFFIFIFTLFYFTILYWFCHTLTWIRHGCTWVPNPEPPSHLPLHAISLGHLSDYHFISSVASGSSELEFKSSFLRKNMATIFHSRNCRKLIEKSNLLNLLRKSLTEPHGCPASVLLISH